MPLRDHFHAPWADTNPWEGFHSAWINTLVRHLNGPLLPSDYRAIPNVHLGPSVEADVSTWDSSASTPATGSGSGNPLLWAPPAATQTLEIESTPEETCEVRIVDDRISARLVAVIELVSPANKDRPEHRQTFVAKCSSLLRQGVHVLLIDVLTHRRANLHRELLQALGTASSQGADGELYAVSYRSERHSIPWHVSLWPFTLTVGGNLPTIPLWLNQNLPIPVDLEATYEETAQSLRIR